MLVCIFIENQQIHQNDHFVVMLSHVVICHNILQDRRQYDAISNTLGNHNQLSE
jgi:hypothetical protein